MDLLNELKINSNFRRNVIEGDIIEMNKLLGLTFEEIRLLKFQSLLIESGGAN
tara:strand:+ start:537 stop:695 length:159 start_codon:yes stop_codon:yes gene_type:complete